MYFACEVGDVRHGDWWKVCGCRSETCIKGQRELARNQSHLRRQTFRPNLSSAREKIQTRTMAYQQKKQQQKRKVSLKKGTGGGKARRKLVLGEPQPCPEVTDLDDTLELEELLQLLKDGEDQPPAQLSTPTDPRDTNTFGKSGSVETLRRVQNVVNAGASTSFTPGIVGGEEPPPRQNTNDSGSDLFTGGFHTSLGENSTEVRLPLLDVSRVSELRPTPKNRRRSRKFARCSTEHRAVNAPDPLGSVRLDKAQKRPTRWAATEPNQAGLGAFPLG
ncbi:hypothetical protein Bbelb_038780 [Branchiostoma belcheri]|nr:hypothetical protein Bbelb_038780 [Branchiostoma belcheri]